MSLGDSGYPVADVLALYLPLMSLCWRRRGPVLTAPGRARGLVLRYAPHSPEVGAWVLTLTNNTEIKPVWYCIKAGR